MAFSRARLAVYIDGCFWHGCPEHHVRPRANSEWWAWKIQGNQSRDADTDRQLREANWEVIRVWEHEDPSEAADRIEQRYLELLAAL